MNNLNSSVTAQGAGAVMGKLLSKTNVFSNPSPFFLQRFRVANRVLWMTLLLWTTGMCAFGQNYDTLYTAECNFQITAPNVILSQGESVEVTVEVGTAAEPIFSAVEFDLDVVFTADAEFPTSPDLDLADSWFFDSGTPDTTTELNSTERTLRLTGVQSSPVTGHGRLFHLTVTADANGVNANSLITPGGCIIVVEDLGFKQISGPEAEKAPEIQPVFFPNPCQDLLNFDWKGTLPERVICRNQQGTPVAQLTSDVILSGQWNPGTLPSGLYCLTFFYTDPAPLSKKLIIE